jgi:branched-chain amino acid transport system ATP-binding protein
MNPVLRLDNVCKNFGGVVAADHVSFSVYPGEIHGLIGPNGAGKSTLINLISGIYACDNGRVFLDEREITNVPAHQRARMGIGRTFQTPRFMYRSSIRDNLLLGTDLSNGFGYLKSFFGKKGNDFHSELQDLMSYAGFSFGWEDDIDGMPFGQRKILEIVRALLTHPKVIFVDEPAAGLNRSEVVNVVALLNLAAKKRGIGVLLIEHVMDMVMNVCEQIVVINFGKVIAEGTPEQVSSNNDVIESYLGRKKNA